MPTILLAVNETSLTHRLAARLEQAGLHVICAKDGLDAWASAQREQPDALIVDYRLPRLGGLELCTRLRQHVLTREIEVVLLRSDGISLPADEPTLACIRSILTHPVCPATVLAVIRRLLANRAILAAAG
jgi:CheY-like chemotaxis protein